MALSTISGRSGVCIAARIGVGVAFALAVFFTATITGADDGKREAVGQPIGRSITVELGTDPFWEQVTGLIGHVIVRALLPILLDDLDLELDKVVPILETAESLDVALRLHLAARFVDEEDVEILKKFGRDSVRTPQLSSAREILDAAVMKHEAAIKREAPQASVVPRMVSQSYSLTLRTDYIEAMDACQSTEVFDGDDIGEFLGSLGDSYPEEADSLGRLSASTRASAVPVPMDLPFGSTKSPLMLTSRFRFLSWPEEPATEPQSGQEWASETLRLHPPRVTLWFVYEVLCESDGTDNQAASPSIEMKTFKEELAFVGGRWTVRQDDPGR